MGRAPRTKETLPDFLKWRRVTRPPLVFRGLTGSQRTPGFWGVTAWYQSQGKRLPWELGGCSYKCSLIPASQLGIRAKVNDYLGSSVGVVISVV